MKNKNKINSDESNIKHYNETGHLYGKKIECNCCSTLTTAFGSNLEGKIEKAGGIEKLLATFICRSCKSEAKPKAEKKPSVKREKKDKEEIVYVVPKMKFSEKRNVFLKDAPDIIQAMTNFACASPAYYLDHARSCNGCAYAAYCNCPLKKLAA
jgi:hypothetical protein